MTEVRWVQSSRDYLTVPPELKGQLLRVRKEEPEIEIIIRPVYPMKTENQNALFHAKLGELAAESGANKEWLKREIKMYAVNRGYPYDKIDGQIVPYSTTRINVEQMELLIDCLYDFAFEHGIYLNKEN